MITWLSDTKPVARKTYRCMASEWIENVLNDEEWTYAELRQLVKARRQNWQILPGQQYVKQVAVDNGEFYTFRAIPEMHALCLKYDLYEYD